MLRKCLHNTPSGLATGCMEAQKRERERAREREREREREIRSYLKKAEKKNQDPGITSN